MFSYSVLNMTVYIRENKNLVCNVKDLNDMQKSTCLGRNCCVFVFFLTFLVQFSCSVMSDSLQRHGLQHARPPCPSPTPGVYSKLMSIESVIPSNHLILYHPLLLQTSIFPSIRIFSNESALRIRWPKY